MLKFIYILFIYIVSLYVQYNVKVYKLNDKDLNTESERVNVLKFLLLSNALTKAKC